MAGRRRRRRTRRWGGEESVGVDVGGDRLIDRVTQFPTTHGEKERKSEREREIRRRLESSSRGAIRHNFIDYRRIAEATERPSGSMRRTGT